MEENRFTQKKKYIKLVDKLPSIKFLRPVKVLQVTVQDSGLGHYVDGAGGQTLAMFLTVFFRPVHFRDGRS